MTLAEYMESAGLKDRPLAEMCGWKRSYVTHLRRQSKKLGVAPALKLFEVTGQRFGPLATTEATRKEIAAVARVTGAV